MAFAATFARARANRFGSQDAKRNTADNCSTASAVVAAAACVSAARAHGDHGHCKERRGCDCRNLFKHGTSPYYVTLHAPQRVSILH